MKLFNNLTISILCLLVDKNFAEEKNCGLNEYRDTCGNPCKEVNCLDDPDDPKMCTQGKG